MEQSNSNHQSQLQAKALGGLLCLEPCMLVAATSCFRLTPYLFEIQGKNLDKATLGLQTFSSFKGNFSYVFGDMKAILSEAAVLKS